jgi:hypothetical protein
MPTKTFTERARLALSEGRAALNWFIERDEREEAAAMQSLLADTSNAVREVQAAESAMAALAHATDERADAADEQLNAAKASLEQWLDALEHQTQTRFGCSDEVTT